MSLVISDPTSTAGPEQTGGAGAGDVDAPEYMIRAATVALLAGIAEARSPLAAERVLCAALGAVEAGSPDASDEQERLEAQELMLGQVIGHAEAHASVEALGLLRVCSVLGPATCRRAAHESAARLAAAGVPDRPWASRVGSPQMLRAWDRRRPRALLHGGRLGDLSVEALAGAAVTLHAVVPVRAEAPMGKLIYAANTSLDGYLEDETGSFDWSVPDDEVHAFWNEHERHIGTSLYGRRMYETMRVWESDDWLTTEPAVVREYAQIWRDADKIVYSSTLEEVSTARTRIERQFDPEAVRQLKETSTSDLSIGGAAIGAEAFRHGLVDECVLLLCPVLVGGGKPALPRGVRVDLELLDHRRFRNGVIYVRHAVRNAT